jgi:outer membrane protein OmpA-like peptidoglycan-associated protein
MKRHLIVLVVMALTALLGHAQQSSGGTPPPTNGSSSTANGTASAQVVVNQNTESHAGFVQAVPGGIPGTFPGYAPDAPGCRMYAPKGLPSTGAAIDLMAEGEKLPRGVRATPTDPDKETTYSGAIAFMTYNPAVFYNQGDVILGTIIVPNKYQRQDEPLVARMEKELKKVAPGMHRVAVVNCPEVEAVTKANTFGVGVTVSGTPESGNVAGSGAVGFTHGTSKSMRQAHSTFYAYAMNEGSLDYVQPQQSNNGGNAPSTPASPTIKLDVKVDLEPLASLLKELIPQQKPALALMPTPPTPAVDPCADLPKGDVYFRFNRPEVDPQYLPVIKLKEDWLEAHPSCTIAVEGYASFEGSDRYNDPLGEQRAQRVYDILVTNQKIAGQIARYLSAGKHFATIHSPNPENTAADRKVVFAIRNITSE